MPRPTKTIPAAYVEYFRELMGELDRQRNIAPDGSLMHLTYTNIRDWRIETATELDAWELRTIIAIDNARFAQLAEERKKKTE